MRVIVNVPVLLYVGAPVSVPPVFGAVVSLIHVIASPVFVAGLPALSVL